MARRAKYTFRDRIATMGEEGKRNWVYCNPPKGKLHRYRVMVSVFLLVLYFAIPHLKIGDEAFLLFNVLERKFVIFGTVFWPQDFHLFVLGLLSIILFVILFTVVYGRIWCGWMCPQTIFMEMVFRKIEFWLEGSGSLQRIAANSKEFRPSVFFRQLVKHFLFVLISLIVVNNFMAYIVGWDQLVLYIKSGPFEHWGAFVAIMFFSIVFYVIFAKFREQVCVLVCPYGRLQGALLDSNTLMVAYDYKRGEPRGFELQDVDRSKTELGDCIDCGYCFRVCPTGIDIRNGSQLECINCTACIDACNRIMGKLGWKKGLIRYTSENGIKFGKAFRLTGRSIAYTVVLGLLIGALAVLFTVRTEFEANVYRVPGSLYNEVDQFHINNIYNYKVINKTNQVMDVEIKLIEPEGELKLIGFNGKLPENGKLEGVFLLTFNKEFVDRGGMEVKLGFYSGGELLETLETRFVGP